MVKTILTAVLIVLLNVLVGCYGPDSGRSQLMPKRIVPSAEYVSVVDVTKTSEADIIEQTAINRQAYRQGLELLVEYYTRMGNDMKLMWAKDELESLNKVPQYSYIIGAIVAGPDLKASASIPLANYMYEEALRLEKRAGQLIIIKDEDLLRTALYKYNQLIRKHPSSDKIDDAAYRAGGICEHFMDYTIALLYYHRTYQWDPETIYPARYKAAYILDAHLHRRAEALELYKQAIEKENLIPSRREFAEKRVAELTRSDQAEE